MRAFAFIIHPIDPKRDVARKYPFLGKVLPETAINFVCQFWPPVQLSHITGARSRKTGEQIEGWLIAVPYTPQRMLSLPPEVVYRKIVAAGELVHPACEPRRNGLVGRWLDELVGMAEVAPIGLWSDRRRICGGANRRRLAPGAVRR